MLASLSRRELVPALRLPSLDDRALREQLRRRMHPVRLRTSARNPHARAVTQWRLRPSLKRLSAPDAMDLLAARDATFGCRERTAQERRGVAGPRDDLKAGLGEEPRDPAAQQDVVLGDHDTR